MARNKISSLKQLYTALRSLSIAEFMDLSRQGRLAYGAMFDELREQFEKDDELALAGAPEMRALPRHTPVPSFPPGSIFSVAPPGGGFLKVQPVARVEDLPVWVRAAQTVGIDPGLAQDALAGKRELWVTGDMRKIMEQVGFTFEPGEAVKVANVGTDVYAA